MKSHGNETSQANGWLKAAIAVLMVGIASPWLGCSSKASAPADPAPSMQVDVKPAQFTTVQDSSEYVATIKSRNSATLQPQVEGQITRIYVRSGDQVKVGQKLLEIDPLKQQATVSSQEASAHSKQANLEWARVQLERAQKLAAAGVVSKQDLDQAQTAYDAALADVNSMKAQLQEQQVQLHYYEVVAPSDGTVGDIPVHVGDRVTNSTILTTVDRNVDLEAYINVPLERAPDLKLGLRVEIADNEGNRLAGTEVTFISPQVDTTTQSVLVKARVGSAKESMRTAQYVSARVIWRSRPGLVIPVTSVLRVSGQYFAFVAEQKGTGWVAQQRPLELGNITGHDYEVKQGIKAGDKVIVSGSQLLADGTPVALR